jgi:hypothetical protein
MCGPEILWDEMYKEDACLFAAIINVKYDMEINYK